MYHLRLKGEHYQMGVKRGTIFQRGNISFPLHLDTFQLEHGKQSEKILRKFFPEVCEEIRGVSDTIGADYISFISWMLCMGCCMYNLENNIPVEIRGCTAFAYSKDGNIIYGRNNDLPPYLRDGSKSEIYSPINGNRFNITTSSFINGEEGLNEHGLAVGLTSVYPNQCKPGFNAGMIVRYLLEKCKNVSEAVSCLYQLPIASAQTLTLADAMGTITVIECNAEQIKVEKTLNNNLSFVCATNTFHFPEMIGYNNDKIDNWFAEERYQTLYSAFNRKNGGFNLPFAEKLLSGDYGFLCQYDRSTGKDTVWSVIYDMKRHKIYRSEGNPGRHKFKEDTRFQF